MYPSTETVFKILLVARICSAIWSIIPDDDETGNYWEPGHFLIFGGGFKTWEYDVQYSIRSFSFLLFFTFPAYLCNLFLRPNKLLLFYFVRCIFAFSSAICEVCFYRGVCREFGLHIGRMVLIFLLFSPAMYISSTAFLPSTFSMHMTLASFGLWYQRKYKGAIIATACSALFSWPFAGVIGLPIALDLLLLKKKIALFITWSVLSIIMFVPIQVLIDAYFYGKITFTQWNLVWYNIFSPYGPSLYGTEPWYYYFVNCLLNFNFVFLAACLAPFGLLLEKVLLSRKSSEVGCLPAYLTVLSFVVWFGIFIAQPHKEERFLFPVYPLVCLLGAIGVVTLQKLWCCFGVPFTSHRLKNSVLWSSATVTFIFLVSSRVFALHNGYRAPIDVYTELSHLHAGNALNLSAEQRINVCVGKEWHRFPNSFFLPSDQWEMHFIKSDFVGHLADKFEVDSSGRLKASVFVNQENLEEPSRYVDLNICHFLVDLDNGIASELAPNYSALTYDWLIVKSAPFLDTVRPKHILEAFYIPFAWDRNKFGSYNLLASRKKFTPATLSYISGRSRNILNSTSRTKEID